MYKIINWYKSLTPVKKYFLLFFILVIVLVISSFFSSLFKKKIISTDVLPTPKPSISFSNDFYDAKSRGALNRINSNVSDSITYFDNNVYGEKNVLSIAYTNLNLLEIKEVFKPNTISKGGRTVILNYTTTSTLDFINLYIDYINQFYFNNDTVRPFKSLLVSSYINKGNQNLQQTQSSNNVLLETLVYNIKFNDNLLARETGLLRIEVIRNSTKNETTVILPNFFPKSIVPNYTKLNYSEGDYKIFVPTSYSFFTAREENLDHTLTISDFIFVENSLLYFLDDSVLIPLPAKKLRLKNNIYPSLIDEEFYFTPKL